MRENATRNPAAGHYLDVVGSTCGLNLGSHHPVLIDADFADLQTPIPWWDGRILLPRLPLQ